MGSGVGIPASARRLHIMATPRSSSPRRPTRKGRSAVKAAPTFKLLRLTPKSSGVNAVYEVSETHGDKRIAHLVFCDRFGIYCESHGKECPAVAPVTKEYSRKKK